MPGIPLLNIGTALGGLAGGWNQAQSQGLQQAIQRLALQQQQGLTNQQTLAGLALQAGLLNQPGGGQTPLGAATGAVPNQTSAPTPGGGVTAPPGYAPPLPNAPPAPGDSGGSSLSPQDLSYYNQNVGPGGDMTQQQYADYLQQQRASNAEPADSGDLTLAGQVMHNPKVLASWQDASGAASGSGYVLPGGPVQPSSDSNTAGRTRDTPLTEGGKTYPPGVMSPSELAQWHAARNGGASATSTLTAPSASGGFTQPNIPTLTKQDVGGGQQSSDSGQSGGVGIQLPNGQVIDMSTMFQHVDYQKLAQGIARLAPPGTSQADIYGAVLDLNKLADGDRVQQQQAGLLLRALTNGQFSLARTAMTTGTAKEIAAGKSQTSEAIAAGHDATRTALANQADATKRYVADQTARIRQEATQANTTAKWAQIAQKYQQMAQTLAAQGQREAATAINQQLRALQARIAAINTMGTMAGGVLTPDQQEELQQINNNIASIGAKVGAQQGAGP